MNVSRLSLISAVIVNIRVFESITFINIRANTIRVRRIHHTFKKVLWVVRFVIWGILVTCFCRIDKLLVITRIVGFHHSYSQLMVRLMSLELPLLERLVPSHWDQCRGNRLLLDTSAGCSEEHDNGSNNKEMAISQMHMVLAPCCYYFSLRNRQGMGMV